MLVVELLILDFYCVGGLLVNQSLFGQLSSKGNMYVLCAVEELSRYSLYSDSDRVYI